MCLEESLWQQTPLIRSSALSDKTGCEVYLKIETFQTSGSFKGRGVSHFANCLVQRYLQGSNQDTRSLAVDALNSSIEEWRKPTDISAISKDRIPHFVIASAGNAGLAAASAARIIGAPITIFVPEEQRNIIQMFERHNTRGTVRVRVGGVNYAAAAQAAREYAEELGDTGILVPAYDDPLVWQGNSTIIHEVAQQLPNDVRPDAIFCSVGGAGLIGGLMLGCESVPGWDTVPIVGLEPPGSACFYHSVLRSRGVTCKVPEDCTFTEVDHSIPFDGLATNKGNAHSLQMIRLGHVASRASSLGASSPSVGAVSMAVNRAGPLRCVTVSDERAMSAALQFADDHCVVAELACALTLVPAYTPRLLDHLVPRPQPLENGKARKRVLVFVVCGGSKGSYHDLCRFQEELKTWDRAADEIFVDGITINQ